MRFGKAAKVTVFITGNGSRDWVRPSPSDDQPAPLRRFSVLHNRTGPRLHCLDIRDPLLMELLIKPKALHVVTMSLVVPSKIGSILRQISSFGVRSSPPVWLVATEADLVDASSLRHCKSRSETLAAKHWRSD